VHFGLALVVGFLDGCFEFLRVGLDVLFFLLVALDFLLVFFLHLARRQGN
jgi:hypothetical protein